MLIFQGVLTIVVPLIRPAMKAVFLMGVPGYHGGPRLTGHDGDVTVEKRAEWPSFRTHPRVHSPNE